MLAQVTDNGVELGGLFNRFKVNVEDYSDTIEKIKGLKTADIFKDGKVNADAFSKAIGTSDTRLIGYVETLKTAKGRTDLTTASTKGLSQYLKETGQLFDFTAIKAKLLNGVLNAGIGLVATFAIGAVIKGLDASINRVKYAQEAMEKAQQAIDESQNKLKSASETISKNKERFLELSIRRHLFFTN